MVAAPQLHIVIAPGGIGFLTVALTSEGAKDRFMEVLGTVNREALHAELFDKNKVYGRTNPN